MEEGVPSAVERRALDRWAGLGGAFYVVLFIVGSLVSFSGQPDSGDPPAKLISYYSDGGHRDKIIFGWFLILLAVFFFIWFVGALRQAVRRLDGDGVLSTVVGLGGAAYGACTLVAFSVDTGVKTMSDDTYRHQVFPELIHAAGDVSYVIHSAGGAAIGALMIAASLAALRARVVPTWAGWLGILAGIVAIVSIFFFPWFVIAVWLLVVSGILVRAPRSSRVAPPAPV